MSIKKLSSKDFKQIIDNLNKRRKYIRYSFQEIGYMLAYKLNDLKHKSLYFKLAKYENRELIMRAFMYAVDSNNFNKGPLFMWKLKQLRETTVYRAFVGLFLENVSTVSRALMDQLKESCYQDLIKTKYFIKPSKWHVTLAFWTKFPGSSYMSIIKLLEEFKNTFLGNDDGNYLVNKIEYKNFNNSRYVFLTNFDKKIYDLNKALKLFIKNYNGKNKQLFVSGIKSRFYPHITIARLKDDSRFSDCNYEINLNLKLSLSFAISKLTKNGLQYKIHSIN